MKRTLLVIIVLVLMLGLTLVACHSGTQKEVPSFPTPVEVLILEEKIFDEVTSPSTSAGDLVIEGRISEDMMVYPTPVGDKIFWEVIPSLMPAGDPVAGEKIFVSACRVCHRKDLIHNDFIAGRTDQELVEFIKIGGVPNEPLVMLPKGGKPLLTDENLYDIAVYLRSLQK